MKVFQVRLRSRLSHDAAETVAHDYDGFVVASQLFKILRECANRSRPAAGSGVPAVEDPGPA
jgi:hypothetical protein